MTVIVYDGSFEGFLSAVFDIYEYRFGDVEFSIEENYQKNIFDKAHEVLTSGENSRRVQAGLRARLSAGAMNQLYSTFLSEISGIENSLLSYIRYAFSGQAMMEKDCSHAAVLTVQQTARMVHREKHRMEAFIRFQLTADGLYYALIDPDFNVLPLIAKHFRERYADQCWMIYDTRRKYGLYFDQKTVVSISMQFEEAGEGKNIRSLYDEHEALYQILWKQYFSSVNIAARKNMKLHIRHMPRRYWRYLTEKL